MAGDAWLRTAWRVLAAVCLLPAQVAAIAEPGDSRVGRSIYRDGLLASGQPMRATVQAGVALEGAAAACVNCHRRSGLGGSEGQSKIRPVAGRLLFASSHSQPARRRGVPAAAAIARPPYTRATLARALREGVDPAGRVLDALMPRYALSDDDVAQLHAYLEGLSPTAAAGVDEREIHFSTIIAPGVQPQRRRAMLDVLQAFFRDKNGGSRQEARRREVGTEQMYLAYRRWVLHVWELEGAPQTWQRQLDAYYRTQPVFAVVGGLGSGDWRPVHAFCEDVGLPCVFPDVDDPVDDGAGYYSLYYSRGIALEADVLAKHIAQTRVGAEPIVQVFRDNDRGRVMANAMRDALRRRSIETVADHPVADGKPLSAGFWTELLGAARPGILILWLDAAGILSLAEMGEPPARLKTVYGSARQSSLQAGMLPDGWRERIRLVDLFERPDQRHRHLARMNAWLRARHVPLADPRAQANAYFAVAITGDAMASLGENFSRDYFIERIEQIAASSPSPSIYPRLSLGPGQRFASRGGYILGFPQGKAGMPVPVTDWLIP